MQCVGFGETSNIAPGHLACPGVEENSVARSSFEAFTAAH